MTLPADCGWVALWPDGTYYINGAVDPLTVGHERVPALGPKPKEGK